MISAFGVEHVISKGKLLPFRPHGCHDPGCGHLSEITRSYRPNSTTWRDHAADALEAGHSDDEVGKAIDSGVQRHQRERMSDLAEQGRIKMRGVKMELKRRERGR